MSIKEDNHFDLNKPFVELLLQEMSKLSIESINRDDELKVGQRIKEIISGHSPSNKDPIGPPLSKEGVFIKEVFDSFSEIQSSLGTMEMVPIFLSHFPAT